MELIRIEFRIEGRLDCPIDTGPYMIRIVAAAIFRIDFIL
jgi:hypothetical protein